MSQIRPTNRIHTQENIVRKTEAVSPRITITWDPGTTDGLVEYSVMDLVIENGVKVGLAPHTRLKAVAGAPMVRVTLDEVLNSMIEVELPDGTLYPLPGGLVVGAVKAVFDRKFNELLEAQINAENAASAPEPTNPDPSPTPEGPVAG